MGAPDTAIPAPVTDDVRGTGRAPGALRGRRGNVAAPAVPGAPPGSGDAGRGDIRSTGPFDGPGAVAAPDPEDPAPGLRAARAFGEVLAAAGPQAGLDGVLRPAIAAMAALVGVSRCSLYLVDGRSGRFRGRLGHPRRLDRALRQLTMGGPSDALTADVLRTRAPVTVPDVSRDPRTARGAIRDLQVRSVLGVPLIHDGRVLGLVYLDDEGRRREFSAADASAALAFAALVAGWIDRSLRIAQLGVLREELARDRAVLQRVALAEERLCDVRDGSVDDVLAVVAELAARPVELVNTTGVVIGRAEAPGTAGVALGREGARHLIRAAAGSPTGRALLVEPDLARGLTHRCVVVPLELRAGERCLLALLETASHLGHVDHLLAARAGAAVAAADCRAPASAVTRPDTDALLAAQVLGCALSPDEALAMAARAGVDPTVTRLVAVVAGAPSDAGPAVLASALSPWRSTGLALDDHTTAVLVEVPSGVGGAVAAADVRDDLVAVLAELGSAGATVGVSTACGVVEGLPRALAQARSLVHSAAGAQDGTAVTGITTYEIGPARLLLTDAADARALGEEILGALLDDDPSIRDLLSTLETFFASGSSIRLTAQACGVHENTVRHRFGRVRSMTGLDVVGESEDQLMARAALGALRLAGVEIPSAA